MTGQETRNKLTDYWVSNEVQQGQEFANLILSPWLRRGIIGQEDSGDPVDPRL